MLKKIFICDVCGKEIDYSNEAGMEYSQGSVYLEPKNNSKHVDSLKFYLCEGCFNKVVNYINGLSRPKPADWEI